MAIKCCILGITMDLNYDNIWKRNMCLFVGIYKTIKIIKITSYYLVKRKTR